MPVLENPNWEKACQAHAAGQTKTQAYGEVFGSWNFHSTRLFNKPEVRARLAEIAFERATMADVTAAHIIDQLKAVAYKAKSIATQLDGDKPVAAYKLRALGSSIQANELLGKYLGMWNDKNDQNGLGGGRTIVEVYWGDQPQQPSNALERQAPKLIEGTVADTSSANKDAK